MCGVVDYVLRYNAMLFAPVCQPKIHMWFMSIKYDQVGLSFSYVYTFKELDQPVSLILPAAFGHVFFHFSLDNY